jgi:hypothetical protein
LIVVVHMIGLGIVRSFTRMIKGLGFLVDGWERIYPLPRYHGRMGEKVRQHGAIGGQMVQRVIMWRSIDLSGGRRIDSRYREDW